MIPGAGIYMLGTRTFGDASRQAREDGADIGGQFAYGAGRALTATQIEKAFDGLNGLYGKGDLDKIVKEFAEKLRGNEMRQKLVKAILDDTGKALESLATSVADQLLKSVYNSDSIGQNFASTEWSRVRRKALIDAVLNVLSGDSGMVK